MGGVAVLMGVALAACARQGAPPGGPEDRLPPLVVGTDPDTFARVEPGRRTVTFRFSERISERAASGTLGDAVRVSPVTGRVSVEHDRRSLKVSLAGGFREGLVYRVTVLPLIRDLFGNVMADPFELVFSTGGEFHPTLVAGRVVDRITGEPVQEVRVQAVAPESPLTHVAVGDSAGIFALRYLPPSPYRLTAFQDRNRNDSVNLSEPQGGVGLNLGAADTVVLEEISLLVPDTSPPVLASVDVVDSLALEITFDDYLDPEISLDGVQAELVADSTTADSVSIPGVEGVYHPWVLQALRDSIRQARADSVARAEGEEPEPEEEEPDEAPEAEEHLPGQTARVLLMGPLQPSATYRLNVSDVTNIYGTPGGGGSVAFETPAPPPPDTAAVDSVPGDSLQVVPDTTAPPPDTTSAPPDTSAPPADTAAAPDSASVPPDTTGAPPDTTRVRRGALQPVARLLDTLRPFRERPFRRPPT